MRTLAIVFTAAVLVGLALSAGWAQNVTLAAPAGFIPETVLIKATMAPDGQVCAEPASGGLVACRSVKEFRLWVRERPGK